MKKSSIWAWVISRLVVVGLVLCASAAQAATASVPAVVNVINRGVDGSGRLIFDVQWAVIQVPDRQLSLGVCNFGIGMGDLNYPGQVNMSNGFVGTPFPVQNMCNTPSVGICWINGSYNLACVGQKFVDQFGTSGTATAFVFASSQLGMNPKRVTMCAAAQQTVTGPQAAVGIIPETCYNGFPVTPNASCSIDTPELLLDHGSLNPIEVNGNVKEIDLNISCTPSSVNMTAFTAGGNVIFFGNGTISSMITIDGQNPRRATINGTRTFKLRSTLSASGSLMPGPYGNSTTLMINID